jgi:hypothetical protein
MARWSAAADLGVRRTLRTVTRVALMKRAVGLISCGWLIVAASYLSWAYCAISQGTVRKVLSNVDIFAWSLATPFATIVAAPIAAVLVWRARYGIVPPSVEFG